MAAFKNIVEDRVGSGDVVGPASSTDNAIVRFDSTTGKLLQDSGVTIDDTNNMIVAGNLTVQGTTTTIDSTTLLVSDKNIEMGVVSVPSDVTADGGGITLKGSTDKTIIRDDTNDNWTSSEHWNIASGKAYKINNVDINTGATLSNVAYLDQANVFSSVGTTSFAGKVGVGLTPTANMDGLSIEAGILTIKETTTPTADTNYGKIYTKTDNELYFQDGAGSEHQVSNQSGGIDPVYIMAGSGNPVSTTIASWAGGTPAELFADAATKQRDVSTVVPVGATSISSIKVSYIDGSSSALNLRINFETANYKDTSSAVETDSAGSLLYASGGTASRMQKITVPSTAYDGLTVTAGGVMSFSITRSGGHVDDTYGLGWYVTGVEIVFA